MNICFYCDGKVYWQSDFDYEDYGIDDKEGIVSNWTCSSCGAEYEVYVTISEENEVM